MLRGRFSHDFAELEIRQPPVVRVRTRVGYDVFFCFCLCGGAGGERRSACIAQAQQRCSSGKATSAVLCEAVVVQFLDSGKGYHLNSGRTSVA